MVGEESIGILVKKSPREVGFFARTFQEFLSSKHLISLDFEQQLDVVGLRATDPRWGDVILCLLHQLRRPAEVDGLLEKIEGVEGDIATCAVRDTLLAEATFGEIRKSPQTATRLADKAFEQIEIGHGPRYVERWRRTRSTALPRRFWRRECWISFNSGFRAGTATAWPRPFPPWANGPTIRAFGLLCDAGCMTSILEALKQRRKASSSGFRARPISPTLSVGWSQRRRPSVRRRPRWKPFGGLAATSQVAPNSRRRLRVGRPLNRRHGDTRTHRARRSDAGGF